MLVCFILVDGRYGVTEFFNSATQTYQYIDSRDYTLEIIDNQWQFFHFSVGTMRSTEDSLSRLPARLGIWEFTGVGTSSVVQYNVRVVCSTMATPTSIII